jgi:hypothetical protein
MKLRTTFLLDRYEIAAGLTPECAAAGRTAPQYYDVSLQRLMFATPDQADGPSFGVRVMTGSRAPEFTD